MYRLRGDEWYDAIPGSIGGDRIHHRAALFRLHFGARQFWYLRGANFGWCGSLRKTRTPFDNDLLALEKENYVKTIKRNVIGWEVQNSFDASSRKVVIFLDFPFVESQVRNNRFGTITFWGWSVRLLWDSFRWMEMGGKVAESSR